jgi:hypothetical protein
VLAVLAAGVTVVVGRGGGRHCKTSGWQDGHQDKPTHGTLLSDGEAEVRRLNRS